MTQLEAIVRNKLFKNLFIYYKTNNFPIDIRIASTKIFNFEDLYWQTCANLSTPSPFQNDIYANFGTNFFRRLDSAARTKEANATRKGNVFLMAEALEFEIHYEQLKAQYQSEPIALFYAIDELMKYEKTLLAGVTPTPEVQQLPSETPSFPSSLSPVVSYFHEYEELNKHFDSLPGTLIQIFNRLSAAKVHMQNSYPPNVVEKNRFQKEVDTVFGQIQWFLGHMLKDEGTDKIMPLMKQWRTDQLRSLNGSQICHDLEQISDIANKATSLFVQLYMWLRQLVNDSQLADFQRQITTLQSLIQKQLHSLLLETFVVEEQPNQMLVKGRDMQRDKQGSALKVRLLTGSAINERLANPLTLELEAFVIDEGDAMKLFYEKTHPTIPKTKDGKKEMLLKAISIDGNFTADFNKCRIPTRPGDRKGSEVSSGSKPEKQPRTTEVCKIPEKKHWFYIRTTLRAPELDFEFLLFTTSAPVAITARTDLHVDSWPHLIWHNELCDLDDPFKIAKEMSGRRLIRIINYNFKMYTGRELSEDNQDFLWRKLMGLRAPDSQSDPEKVTWQQFFSTQLECMRPTTDEIVCDDGRRQAKGKKDNPPPVTFHVWIYTILKMCSKGSIISKYWKDSVPGGRNVIEGFITKENLQISLRTPGFFMLYFSEALLGGLTVAFCSSRNNVEKLSPYVPTTFKDFPLERRIKDRGELTHLYPGVPKENVFNTSTDEINSLRSRWGERMVNEYIFVCLKEKLLDLSSSGKFIQDLFIDIEDLCEERGGLDNLLAGT